MGNIHIASGITLCLLCAGVFDGTAVAAARARSDSRVITTKSYVDAKVKTVRDEVATLQGDIRDVNTKLDEKANQSQVDALAGEVSALTGGGAGGSISTQISAAVDAAKTELTRDISNKADKLIGVSAKAGNVAYVDAAGQYQVSDTNISSVATTGAVNSAIDSAVAGVNTTFNEGLDKKADKVATGNAGKVAVIASTGNYAAGTVDATKLVTSDNVNSMISAALSENDSINEIVKEAALKAVADGDVVGGAINESLKSTGAIGKALAKKADVSDFDSLSDTVTDNKTKTDSAIAEINTALDGKASSDDLDTLAGRVEKNETAITTINTTLDTLATSASVTELSGTVGTNTTGIAKNAENIATNTANIEANTTAIGNINTTLGTLATSESVTELSKTVAANQAATDKAITDASTAAAAELKARTAVGDDGLPVDCGDGNCALVYKDGNFQWEKIVRNYTANAE